MTRRRDESAADRQWRRERRAGLRWAALGALAGAAAGVIAWAPADWVSAWVRSATDEHLLLAEAAGTVWSGSAVAVLTGGTGSRDASALPGRLHWALTPRWNGLTVTLRQDCCIANELPVVLEFGWRRLRVELPARPAGLPQWPARWLSGLGTPWNTLQLGGALRLASPGMAIDVEGGRARFSGTLEAQLVNASSRVSAVDPLGSYRLSLRAGSSPSEPAALQLETTEGALQLGGSGQWSSDGMKFRGQARAAEGQEAALSNLLNIIGRRQGALSVISIG